MDGGEWEEKRVRGKEGGKKGRKEGKRGRGGGGWMDGWREGGMGKGERRKREGEKEEGVGRGREGEVEGEDGWMDRRLDQKAVVTSAHGLIFQMEILFTVLR